MEEYHQITLNEWQEWKRRLRQELNNVKTAFVRVGFVLRKIDETEAYKVEGYKSVAEFAEKEFGLKPCNTSRWMAINRVFSVDGYSEQLDARYADMNASQLTEMLGLPMEDRELVTPGTSREELRELRRFNRESESSGSGADASPLYGAFAIFLDNNPPVAEKVMECLRGGNAGSDHIAEAVAPSGSRMYRAGTKFITFQKSDIKVKIFGGNGAESVSWEEFAEIARQWADEKEREEPKAESGVRAAAVEDPAESAGEESPEGSRGEVAESRGVDDERKEEVSEYEGDGVLHEVRGTEGADGSGGRGVIPADIGGTGSTCGVDSPGREEDSGTGSRGESHEGSGAVGTGDYSGEEDGKNDGCRKGSSPGTERDKGVGGEGVPEGIEIEIQETEAHENEETHAEVREVSVYMNPPTDVDDVEVGGLEIAPAQFGNADPDEDGDSSREEELTISGKISQARQEVRCCMREIASKIDFKKWNEAHEAAVELLGYLKFLKENDGGGDAPS